MTTIVDSNLPVARPSWDHSRLESRIVHLGCGAFHRAHQALYTHHLLESTDSDWGICEVNLMPGNDRVLIENLKKQQLLYTVAEKGAESTELKIIGSMKEALHPEIDGCEGILNAMARPQTAIVSLTVTEKGYCADAASGQLDLNNPLIKHDLENPTAPKSAIGYIVEALRLRREKGLKAFTVMSCDNVRENGHVAKVAVLGLAQARDPQLAAWIEENVTFPCTMVDRIVPAATPETLQEIADQLGVYDPCAIACEPFRQWVIEDNFVNGRPDWDKVGAQFVADVVPFEMMKLRMLNGSHSFLAYLGYLGGYETIADTMTNPAYRKAAFALMMQEQAPTLSMPEGTDLNAYATLLIERFSNPSLRHRTWQIAMDGSQKLPQRLLDPVRLHLQNGGSWRLLDPVRLHLQNGGSWRHLALGVAGWMRYTQGVDEQGNAIDVVDPMLAEFQKINAQYQGADRVKALLGLSGIFADDLPQNADFVGAVTAAYQQLCERGARECVAAL
ncbi:fructuronate reductase [Escherichia coli]|nr:fructuronate reductase [Escherichia coli]